MSNTNTQVVLYNTASQRTKSLRKAADLRHIAKLERYAEARRKNPEGLTLTEIVVEVINNANNMGITREGVQALTYAEYGLTLNDKQVYDAVSRARKQGLIKQYDNAYYG